MIVFVALIALSATGRAEMPIAGTDSMGYAHLANNILEHGTFSLSYSAPFAPDAFRTPGYPLFIALCLLIFRSFFSVAVIQNILAGISAVLVYRITRFFVTEKFSLIAALMFALEPSGIYLSNIVLSESVFTFFLVWAVYSVLKKDGVAWHVGVLLGCAALIRPIGLIVAGIVIGFLFFKKQFARGVVVALCCVVALTPWIARNVLVFDTIGLSDVSVRKLFSYDATLFYAYTHRISDAEASDILRAKLAVQTGVTISTMTLRESSVVRDFALGIIREDPTSFAKFYTIKTIPFFITDGFTDTARKMGFSWGSSPHISKLFLTEGVGGIFRELRNTRGINFTVYGFGVLAWMGICIVMLYGALYVTWQQTHYRWEALFLLSIVIVTAFLTGTVANARLRYPVTPYMFTLFAVGIFHVRRSIVSWYGK